MTVDTSLTPSPSVPRSEGGSPTLAGSASAPSTPSAAWRGVVAWAAALGLLAAGFGLRLYCITDHGIWFDEAHSYHMSRLGIVDMVLAAARDSHPPLYYILLAAWTPLAGAGEFNLRFLSTALGTLALPLAFALGRSLAGRAVGVMALALIAASPLLVYYAQETRMYALSVSLATAAACFAWRAVQLLPTRRWLPGYVIATVLGGYTHFFGLLSLPAFNLAYLLWAVPRLWRRKDEGRGWARPLAEWALAQGLVLAAFLPWLFVLGGRGDLDFHPLAGPPLDSILLQTGRAFTLGVGTPAQGHDELVAALAALALVGTALPVWLVRRQKAPPAAAPAALFVALWLVVGFAFGYAELAGKRDFAARYLITLLPAYLTLASLACVSLGRLFRPLLLVAVALAGWGAVVGLTAYYDNTNEPRPDYRGAIRAVQRFGQPGDVVVANAAYATVVLDYYGVGGLPYVGLPTSPRDRTGTEAALSKLATQYKRLWGVFWQDYFWDPDGIVDDWLRRNTVQFYERHFLDWIRVKGYELRRPGELVFGKAIRLERYEVQPAPAEPGKQLKVILHWRCVATPPRDYHVFVHLVDGDYTFFGQDDGPPSRTAPTTAWTPGLLVTDEHILQVAEGAAGKNLVLRVGLYELASGKRLSTAISDDLLLAQVPVRP